MRNLLEVSFLYRKTKKPLSKGFSINYNVTRVRKSYTLFVSNLCQMSTILTSGTDKIKNVGK